MIGCRVWRKDVIPIMAVYSERGLHNVLKKYLGLEEATGEFAGNFNGELGGAMRLVKETTLGWLLRKTYTAQQSTSSLRGLRCKID